MFRILLGGKKKNMTRLGPDDRPAHYIDIIDGYNRWAVTYDERANPLVALEENVTLELIVPVQGMRVLDLGCGTGRYCLLLANQGASVVGVDPAVQMIEQAKRKTINLPSIKLLCGTLDQMNFPDGAFDLVVSALTLSHITDLEPTFREVVRVLKSDGRMVISDIHPYWPISSHDYVEFFDETGKEFRIPEYPHLIEEYWQLFKKFGLRVEEIREPKIENKLISQFPILEDHRGVPLAVVLKAWKK